jgi:hypothetical protein
VKQRKGCAYDQKGQNDRLRVSRETITQTKPTALQCNRMPTGPLKRLLFKIIIKNIAKPIEKSKGIWYNVG